MRSNERPVFLQDGWYLGKSVLLVEDDVSVEPIWRLIFSHARQKTTLDWVTSETGAQRLILLKQERGLSYDLIITDIFLSGCKTGIDLWRENQLKGTAFIFTSNVSALKFSQFFACEKGCPPFIAKPIDPTICLATIDASLMPQKAPTSGSHN
jgi:CheY-like chemotaxis protein